MEHIFLSYSKADKAFALQLVRDLERFYNVWIDKEQLSGGLEWEQMIDKALMECGVFAVIVSADSNKSEWVARETIRAEQLTKFRIPILLNGSLPLRLLNVQYVDFQGEYEGGFRDLLEVLKGQLKSEDRNQGEANCLIGEGLRAYFAGDYPKANSLIGQALVLDAGIAQSIEAFWDTLRKEPKTDWASQLMPQIEIRETGNWPDPPVFEMRDGQRYEYYEWGIEIATDDATLDKIDYVRYKLHETFREPIQTVRARDQKFWIGGVAWGTFNIHVTIYFKDGTVGEGSYDLEFKNRQIPLLPE